MPHRPGPRCPLCGRRSFGEDFCIICGKHFHKTSTVQVTCGSRKCHNANNKRRGLIWRSKNRGILSVKETYKRENVKLECSVCGTKVIRERKNQRTCSSVCAKEWNKKTSRDSRNWLGKSRKRKSHGSPDNHITQYKEAVYS